MSPTVPPISTRTMSTSFGDGADVVLDLVGDVRDDLDGPAEVVAAPLLLDHRQVDLAGRPVVVAGRDLVGEPLVVSEVEVGLGAVVGDVDLAVLVRAHRAGVDVDVRIELLQGDLVAVPFEQRADRGGREPLAERRHDAAGHEDVLHGPGCACPGVLGSVCCISSPENTAADPPYADARLAPAVSPARDRPAYRRRSKS